MTETEDWARLAAEVRRRREKMRLPIDLVDVGGPTEMTVRKIESGEPASIRPKTKVRLEHALRWPDGTVDRILDGTVGESELEGRGGNVPLPEAALVGEVGASPDQRRGHGTAALNLTADGSGVAHKRTIVDRVGISDAVTARPASIVDALDAVTAAVRPVRELRDLLPGAPRLAEADRLLGRVAALLANELGDPGGSVQPHE